MSGFLRLSAAVAALWLVSLPGPPHRAFSATREIQGQKAAVVPQDRLPELLAKAADYCRSLERAAFDFVCREEIAETIDPSLDMARKAPQIYESWGSFVGPTVTIIRADKVKHRFVYDYQCTRQGRTIREVRTELEENGKKTGVPNAELKTSIVVFGTALFGPVGLFGDRFQPDYDFNVVGEEKIDRTKVVVIDASPKSGASPSRNLYGKAWVDPVTGDILKVEWSESRVGRFDIFEKRGQLYHRKPRLIIRSEFKAEKNGIRFPSHLSVEEAYLTKSGRATVRSRTEVTYRDFKFFTVQVEVRD